MQDIYINRINCIYIYNLVSQGITLWGVGGGQPIFANLCQLPNLLFSKFRGGNSKFGIYWQKFHGYNGTILKRAGK